MKRRWISLLLAGIWLLMMMPSVATAQVTINTPEKIGMTDAFAVFSHASGQEDLSIESLIEADVNVDTQVDMIDALAFYQAASGGTSSIPRNVAHTVTDTAAPYSTPIDVEVTNQKHVITAITIRHFWGEGAVKKVCADDNTVYVKVLCPKTTDALTGTTITLDETISDEYTVRLVMYANDGAPAVSVPFEEVLSEDGTELLSDSYSDFKQIHQTWLIRSIEDRDLLVSQGKLKQTAVASFDEAFFAENALVLVRGDEYNYPMDLNTLRLQTRGNTLTAETCVQYANYRSPSLYRKTMVLKVPADAVATVNSTETMRYQFEKIVIEGL